MKGRFGVPETVKARRKERDGANQNERAVAVPEVERKNYVEFFRRAP